MTYSAGDDPLCYLGSQVLINRAGLTDQAHLDEFENAMYILRFEEGFPEGNLNKGHYLAVHGHLFQDVYEWAGQIRKIRIGKGSIWFCFPEHIDRELDRLFSENPWQDLMHGMSPSEFAHSAARFLSALNAVHPFRDGNGRTQMSFLKLIIDKAGFEFNMARLDPERTMKAMVDSFKGQVNFLETLIFDLVTN